jgi:hypothetical protein
MFDLLQDDTQSPGRMPSQSFYGNRTPNPSATLNGYLFIVALGGLVAGEALQAWRAAQIAAWSIAAVAGWWFVYRWACQVQTTWQSKSTRRTRILIGSIGFVLVLLFIVYATAIKSEALMTVGSAVGWGLSLLAALAKHLRRENEPTVRTLLLTESVLFVVALVILVYTRTATLTSAFWVLFFPALLLQQFREGRQESP